MSVVVQKYDSSFEGSWNDFTGRAKNAPFFFNRRFMEYHADRFRDASVILLNDREMLGIVPASFDEKDNTVISHGGLSFGGVITDSSMTTPLFLEAFAAYLDYLRKSGVSTLIYKAVPKFYHKFPAEEELYALFRFGAELFRRDIGSVLNPANALPYRKLRRRMVKKAASAGVRVEESSDFAAYWALLRGVLQRRHGADPVHSLAEIEYLKSQFPCNIRLFSTFSGSDVIAGVVIFESDQVAHAQYIASSEEGRQIGALDLIFDDLIRNTFKDKPAFSFGISTEQEGRQLNEGLISQKEGFGARAVAHDFYRLKIN